VEPSSTTLYVHVPFCVVKCGYCDFNSYRANDDAEVDRFLDALALELTLSGAPRRPRTVFVGGGTPTWLDPARFDRLLTTLLDHVELAGCIEVTLEANPESTTLEKARRAREAGVTRVSIGAQSFAADRLKFLDRAHDADRTRAAVTAVRNAGFDNISLDLMFGLPGQTPDEWEADLRSALELGPDHLSCYNLTFEPGTRLERDRRQGRVAPNDDRLDRRMFVATRELLADHGFHAYEISNFAGRGGPCLHNLHYWRQGDYVGVGPGAASHLVGWRGTNLKPLDAWASSLERRIPATAEAEFLTRDRRASEAIWLGLRLDDGVDLDHVAERLSIDVHHRYAATIAHFAESGLLVQEGHRLRLSPEGVLRADEIGAAFL
jgi:oxygen-independent coproporphyrinogen-3 oxidase